MRSRNGTRTDSARINMGNGMDACPVTRSSYDPTRKGVLLEHISLSGGNEDGARQTLQTFTLQALTINILILSS
jgi:hypothetical protein